MLALDPNETFEITLESEDSKPEADRAKFRFRHLTLGEWRLGLVPNDSGMSALEQIDMLVRCIGVSLVGWSNVIGRDGEPIPYDLDRLEDLVTLAEAWDLYYAARSGARLGGAEKNESGSPSPIPSDVSADTADPKNAKADPTS